MAFNIEAKHPDYTSFLPAWQMMRDAFDGEETVKAAGQKYLPMKSGVAAITDTVKQRAAYDAYKLRAEFPELVAPTVRGSVGIILKQPSKFTLPQALEPVREIATLDGRTLETFNRAVAAEQFVTGRYGIMPGVRADGSPYLAGYTAESIINWDTTDNALSYLVLDESAPGRDVETGEWKTITRYRECFLDGGAYASRVWTKQGDNTWVQDEPVLASTPRGEGLPFIPFVFVGTNDLTPTPDDVPLYGLGRLAVRVYRMDADYTFALHMTSEPTPVAIGFDDVQSAVNDGAAPNTIGSSALWLLPKGGDAKFLEFTGAGIEAQKAAIGDALNRAVAFGAQVFTDTSRAAESGDAIRLRLGRQASLLQTIAMTGAAGIELALRNLAQWLGVDPMEVTVEPNLEFFTEPLSGQDITALVSGWQAGAYSYPSLFDRLKRGNVVPADRTLEQELELIGSDQSSAEDDLAGLGALPKP